MILGFSTINKRTKQPTDFVNKILSGEKVHTLRKGNRWKPGRSIQMATGVRTRNYNQFNKNRPDLQVCKSTQKIKLVLSGNSDECRVYVDGRQLSFEQMRQLAWNDGFCCLAEFWLWFIYSRELPDQIVHWTDLKY